MLAKLNLSLVLWAAASLVLAAAVPANSSGNSSLLLGPINFAGYDNYLYRDDKTAAQIVLSSNASNSKPSRFLVAFPEGNTGVVAYFIPSNASSSSGNSSNSNSTSKPLKLSLDPKSLSTVSGANNQMGLSGTLNLTSDVSLGVVLIGSVRTLRDFTEGSGLTHEIFNYTLGSYSNSSVQFVRHWINGTTVQYLTFNATDNLNISVSPSSNITLPPNITMKRLDGSKNGSLKFSTTFNFTEKPTTQGQGLGPSSLFLDSAPATGSAGLQKVLKAIQGGGNSSSSGTFGERVNEISFLTYQDKFLAGGWRFLTYFGRDTLLALRLLLPTMTSEASESVLGAVLERLNTTGAICHEETIGDYASFVNINNNQSELGNQPSYSYVMVDTDFLLLPSLEHYFLSIPQGANRSSAFLGRQATLQNGTYLSLLERNANWVLDLASPFGNSKKCTDLVKIRDANVGNWRDSNTGLGGGKFPFDVNTALVPGALRAIASLASAGVLPGNYTSEASSLASAWEQNAAPCFKVTLSAQEAESRLLNFIPAANLSTSLLYGAGSLNSTVTNSSLLNRTSTDTNGNTTFYALSLNLNGSAVEVLHSDLGFTLLYASNVSESILRATVKALQPYPRGLLTNVGMVVANPAYDSNTTNIQVFNDAAYHGTVVWSWQQALMANGLINQLSRCGLENDTRVDYIENPATSNSTKKSSSQPSWCKTSLVNDLQNAQTLLWDSISGSSSVLYTEVWSPLFDNQTNKFTIGDLGAISPTGTEGDAVQLWSYGFLATVDPRNGQAVAGGII